MKLTRKIITNNYYQEHSLQTAGEITDRNLESQKEIIKSFQSVWLPNVENAYELFWNKWMSPRSAAGIYARTVSSFADNSIATTRIANTTIVANMEAMNTSKVGNRGICLQRLHLKPSRTITLLLCILYDKDER